MPFSNVKFLSIFECNKWKKKNQFVTFLRMMTSMRANIQGVFYFEKCLWLEYHIVAYMSLTYNVANANRSFVRNHTHTHTSCDTNGSNIYKLHFPICNN